MGCRVKGHCNSKIQLAQCDVRGPRETPHPSNISCWSAQEQKKKPHLRLGSKGLVKIQMCVLGRHDTILLLFQDHISLIF